MINETFVLTAFQQNTRVVACEESRQAICIDPGEPSDELAAFIHNNDLELRAIILTHGHLDHIGGTAALKEAFPDADVLLHEEEMYLYDKLQQQPLSMGIPPHQLAAFGMEYEPAPTPTRFLKHGEVLEIGRLTFEVRHCPGHTLGHIVLVESSSKSVFTGDCLFSGSIGRSDLPGGNGSQLLESINTQLMSLNDDFTIYCGHGPDSTIGRERAGNPFLNH